MIGKKINQLATELAPVSTDLTIIGDPISGVSKKITLAQLGAIFSGAVSFYTNLASFPATGTLDVIFCAKDTQKLYLWSGSAYVEVFPSQALLDTYQLRSEKGVSNGYASLDSSGKVPISQLPSSIMEYKGTWNAATNTPTLANGTGDTGDVYICNVAGTVDFGAGAITFAVGDYVIYSGSIWQRSSGAVGTVTSVAATITGDAIGITGSPVTTSGTLALAFAGTSAQYINGAGNLTTFPSLTGYVPYTGATANVDLGTFDLTADILTAATGSYTSSGGGNTLEISHTSGSGIALNITKGGNGEGLYINKTSGTGNAATIVGTLEATTLVKTGGTSSQFLKADGSVDSSTYLTTSAAATTYLPMVLSSTANSIEINGQFFDVASVANSYTSGRLIIAPTYGAIGYQNAGVFDGLKILTNGNAEFSNSGITRFFNQVRFDSTLTNGTYTYTLPGATGTLALTSDLTGGTVTSVGLSSATSGVTIGSTPITTSGTITLAIATASGSQQGLLSSTDWTTFNNKQDALTNPVTGTGTTNTLPKFTGASTIGNSNVTDSGSLITLGSNTRINTGQDGLRIGADTNGVVNSANTSKRGRINIPQYGNPNSTPVGIISGATDSASNSIIIGGTQGGFALAADTITFQIGATYNATSGTEIARFASNGALGIGTTNLPGQHNLRVSRNISGSTISYGILSEGITQSGVTNFAIMYTSTAQTAAAAFTLNNMVHYFAQQTTLGAGSAITNQYGFWAENSLIGATNNYGFYGNIPSGTNRWNLYMNGTADNYLAGNTGIGGVAAYISSGPILTSTLTNGGSGYVDGTYTDVATTLVSSTGAGALFTIVVSGGVVTSATLTWSGSLYKVNDTITVSNTLLGGTGSGLIITINTVDSSQLTITSTTGADITLLRNDTTLSPNDNVGTIKWISNDSTTKASGIVAEISANGESTNGGAYLSFQTRAGVAGSSLVEAMRISGNAQVIIGANVGSNSNLRVTKTLTGATTFTNISSDGVIQSDVTSATNYYRTVAQTAAASFTTAQLRHYFAQQSTIGAGSTVTNQYGFFVDSTLIGATNNFGFYGAIASGTNRWNLYMNGTAANYLNGDTSIGTTTGGFKLNVGGTLNVTGAATFSSTVSATQFFADVTSGTNQLVLKTGGIDRGYIQASNASLILNSLTSNDIQFHSNSTERMRLNASGNLSIGNTNDSYKLDVSGTGRFTGKLTISNTSDAYAEMTTSAVDGDALFGFSNTGDGNSSWGIGRRNTGEFWIANYTGNFLSGTRTVPFQIASTGAATFSSSVTATQLSLSNTDGYLGTINSTGANGGYFAWQTSGTVIADIGTANQIFGSGGADMFGINARGARNLAFGTNNTERMRITSGGSFLVRSTSGAVYDDNSSSNVEGYWSSQFTSANATSKTLLGGAGSDQAIVGFSGVSSASKQIIIAGIYGVMTSSTAGAETGDLRFYTKPSGNVMSNSERMRIKSNGIINLSNVPSSSAGLSSGDIYKTVAGVLMIV